MTEIVKICKIHGELTAQQIHPKGKSKTGKQYYGCILCKRIVAKKYKELNPEKVKESAYKYDQKKKNNLEWKEKKKLWMHNYQKRRRHGNERRDKFLIKGRFWKRNYFKRNHDKILERQHNNSVNLAIHYVRAHLKNHYGFENPSNELIGAKTNLMMLKREIMTLNVNNGKNKYVKKTRKYKRRIKSENVERDVFNSTEKDY